MQISGVAAVMLKLSMPMSPELLPVGRKCGEQRAAGQNERDRRVLRGPEGPGRTPPSEPTADQLLVPDSARP
jgi:hypothetical protein